MRLVSSMVFEIMKLSEAVLEYKSKTSHSVRVLFFIQNQQMEHDEDE